MRKQIALLACGIAFFGVCCGEKAGLDSPEDKESYSLGFRFGENMKFQGTALDLETYVRGLRDGLAGHEPALTEAEIRSTIESLQKRVGQAQEKTRLEQSAKNLAASQAFLEKNAKKEGVTSLPSGLQYEVLSAGAGRTPRKTDTVTVHYRGTLIDGTEFDSSSSRGSPATFRVDGVIAGWTEALQLMREGAKWRIFLPPDLAYGERGRPPLIPPGSALIFEIELVTVEGASH